MAAQIASTAPNGQVQARKPYVLESKHPQENASMKPELRRSSAYISIMNVRAMAPKAVSTCWVDLPPASHGHLTLWVGSTSSFEGVRHGIKRRNVINVRHRRAEPSALLIEGEREKRTTLALCAQRLLERLAIEVAIEVDQHCLGLALDTRDAAGQKHIASALLTLADLVKRAAGDLCDDLIEDVAAGRGEGHG
jgi:hypothetical protein